jgi:hypothetical protein
LTASCGWLKIYRPIQTDIFFFVIEAPDVRDRLYSFGRVWVATASWKRKVRMSGRENVDGKNKRVVFVV